MTFITQVIDATTATPPGSPSRGDAYIIASGATGDWSGHDFELATWLDSEWLISTPNEGELAWNVDQSEMLMYAVGAWQHIGTQAANIDLLAITISNPPTQAEVQEVADKVDQLITTLIAAGLIAAP